MPSVCYSLRLGSQLAAYVGPPGFNYSRNSYRATEFSSEHNGPLIQRQHKIHTYELVLKGNGLTDDEIIKSGIDEVINAYGNNKILSAILIVIFCPVHIG